MDIFAKQLHLKQTWDGRPIPPSEQISLFFSCDAKRFTLRITAPFFNDNAPATAPGFTDTLWEYEVVELFLLDRYGHYLEIELGPHGHYLLYLLSDVRVVSRTIEPLSVACCIEAGFWRGEMTIACVDIPQDIVAVNGYGIHGQGQNRRYVAGNPVRGESPDFHQLGAFLPLSEAVDWDLI